MSMSEEIDKQEEFVPIPGFPGYAANRLGQIRGRSGYLCPARDAKGYRLTTLNGKCVRVHRVIAKTFLGECPDGLQVDHIDGNRGNNRLSNLRYVTPQGNSDNMKRLGNGPVGTKNAKARLSEGIVRVVDDMLILGFGCAEISRIFGVGENTINDIKHRKTWRRVPCKRKTV